MKHIKTFSEKVMEGMATYLGTIIVIAIVTFFAFMFNQTVQGYRGNMKLDTIMDSIRVLDKNKVDKFTFGVYMEMMDGKLNMKEGEHKQIREALKELQEIHPRQRGASLRDSIAFNIRNRAVFVWNIPPIIYANNTD
jgi:hypothetical protein